MKKSIIFVATFLLSTMGFAFSDSMNLTNQLNNNLNQIHNSPNTNKALLYGGQDLKARLADIEHVASPVKSLELVV